MQLDQTHLWGIVATAIPALFAVFRSRADATKYRKEALVVRTEADAQQTAAFVKAYEHSRADLEQARSFVETAYKHLDTEKELRRTEADSCAKAMAKLQGQLLSLHQEMTDLRDAVFAAARRPDTPFREHTMVQWAPVTEGSTAPRRDHTGPYKTVASETEVTKVERPSLKPKKE